MTRMKESANNRGIGRQNAWTRRLGLVMANTNPIQSNKASVSEGMSHMGYR
jgi:hypothetical protein